MSEQNAQGADEVVDLNNEMKARREKLAALREQGIRSRTISVVTVPQTNCTQSLTRKKLKNWKR
ncbi:lysyl tRNA synthetase [Salmonella enterica subsp. enterica]|nr:lysyl tRNA synthetase [Salmonella enterica subsp. enterica]